ncbi:MAG: AAA family ATPase [Verrucomicrobiales bacterium]|nr:AAA family ATPase [Verrucomicrobiales bacterium]
MPNWHEANQRYLMARLAVVRRALAQHGSAPSSSASSETGEEAKLEQAMAEAAQALPAPAALDSICTTFALSPFERDLLLLCAGIELDSSLGRLCAAAQGTPPRPFATFSLALAALPQPHWSALSPSAALRRWRLIEVGTAEALTTSPLRIDERVLHYLTGVHHLDARLVGLIEPVALADELPPSQGKVAQRIAELLNRVKESKPWPVIHLSGDDAAGQLGVASLACAGSGIGLHRMRGGEVPASAAEREALARLWEREAALSNSALLLEIEESDQLRGVLAFIQAVSGILFVMSREPLRSCKRSVIRFDVPKPDAAEQRRLWQQALGEKAARLNGQIQNLVAQFSFGLEGIRMASLQLLQTSSRSAESQLGAQLWEACRTHARQRLEDLAQRIEPSATWDDLILPEPQMQMLREIAIHTRNRARVYDEWDFASKGARGLGISALFAGPSGTGKTMASEVLARELQLDLYRIDLSQVVSKYIGETEKNLRRVFDAAEEGGALLLFDEADALFGKRSEVKDSHDRYANIEISYLLQRMEAYRGLAILTTNMKSVLDTAFLRRLRFVVQFPFPDAAQRANIWRCIFPRRTPVERLDVAKLARLNVAGGNIRNIALYAAFLAADAGEPVRMTHLLRAARSEYAKIEKPLTDSETSGWV